MWFHCTVTVCLWPSVLRKWCYKEPFACQSCFSRRLLWWNHREQWAHRFCTKIMWGFSFFFFSWWLHIVPFPFSSFERKMVLVPQYRHSCGDLTLYEYFQHPRLCWSEQYKHTFQQPLGPWGLPTWAQVSHAATFGFTGSKDCMPMYESCPSRSLAQWCGLMQDELMSCWIKNPLSFLPLVVFDSWFRSDMKL